MLWYDGSKLPLHDKILKAMDYYIKKYGHTPNLCLVRPENFTVGEYVITVKQWNSIAKNHIWIGMDDHDI